MPSTRPYAVILLMALLVAGTGGFLPPRPSAPAAVELPANLHLRWPSVGQAAIALDGGRTLGTSGPVGTAQAIASVTKTMTAYVILHDHPLPLGRSGPVITVTRAEAAALPGQRALHESLIPVHAGERFTENQALQALMLASADNMAQILARWDAGSPAAFESRMRATARTLKMTHTSFDDPSGYRPGSRSTATDLIKLGEAAIANPYFAHLVSLRSAAIPGLTVHNYNKLLGVDGVFGIKTGSTYWAGGCLLFAVRTTVHGRPVVLVGAVLGQHGSISTMLPHVFAASRALIESAEAALARQST